MLLHVFNIINDKFFQERLALFPLGILIGKIEALKEVSVILQHCNN